MRDKAEAAMHESCAGRHARQKDRQSLSSPDCQESRYVAAIVQDASACNHWSAKRPEAAVAKSPIASAAIVAG